jgi:hypothetical protein
MRTASGAIWRARAVHARHAEVGDDDREGRALLEEAKGRLAALGGLYVVVGLEREREAVKDVRLVVHTEDARARLGRRELVHPSKDRRRGARVERGFVIRWRLAPPRRV